MLSEDAITNNSNSAPTHGAGGPPNRPLPPTPDDDQGDRTLIMKRVSFCRFYFICSLMLSEIFEFFFYLTKLQSQQFDY